MRKERRYRRFDLLSTLAVLGCTAMLLFEGFFVFEIYDRSPTRLKEVWSETVRPFLTRRGEVAPAPDVNPKPLVEVIPEAGPAVSEEAVPVETPADPLPAAADEPAGPVAEPSGSVPAPAG